MVDFAKLLKKRQRRIDLNPSAADRWTTCTASPKYIYDNFDRLPPEDRTYSDEGNTAHEVAAALLQGRKVNPAECPIPVKPEMNWHGWQYMEFVESHLKPGGRIIVEKKLPLFYAEGRNAIIDAAVINPDGLHVIDYKYGAGVIVSPQENLQATIYAKSVVWGAPRWNIDERGIPQPLRLPDDFPVTVSIYQPRSRNAEDAPFHSWETVWGDIRERSRNIFDIATNILAVTDPINPRPYNLEFKPSDKACGFCPAKGFCTARPENLTKQLAPLALLKTLPSGPVLTETQLAAIVEHGEHIVRWINDARAYALQYMKGGGKIPGFKLVTSRGGNRYWSNPTLAGKYLLADTILEAKEIFEQKIIGPAGVEKLLGKGKFPMRVYNLISKPPGQPVIASEDDPRESALIDAANEFEDLDAGTESDGQRAKLSLDQF